MRLSKRIMLENMNRRSMTFKVQSKRLLEAFENEFQRHILRANFQERLRYKMKEKCRYTLGLTKHMML